MLKYTVISWALRVARGEVIETSTQERQGSQMKARGFWQTSEERETSEEDHLCFQTSVIPLVCMASKHIGVNKSSQCMFSL